jgi:hypothetical protein
VQIAGSVKFEGSLRLRKRLLLALSGRIECVVQTMSIPLQSREPGYIHLLEA